MNNVTFNAPSALGTLVCSWDVVVSNATLDQAVIASVTTYEEAVAVAATRDWDDDVRLVPVDSPESWRECVPWAVEA